MSFPDVLFFNSGAVRTTTLGQSVVAICMRTKLLSAEDNLIEINRNECLGNYRAGLLSSPSPDIQSHTARFVFRLRGS